MRKKLLLFLAVVGFSSLVFATVPSQSVAAAPKDCNTRFLTFPTWYNGLTDDKCNFKAKGGEDGIAKTIWRIALNILEILIQLVAYLAAGFIIWGGFIYLSSGGSSDGIARGRKMITNAVIGLVLALGAVFVISFAAGTLLS